MASLDLCAQQKSTPPVSANQATPRRFGEDFVTHFLVLQFMPWESGAGAIMCLNVSPTNPKLQFKTRFIFCYVSTSSNLVDFLGTHDSIKNYW